MTIIIKGENDYDYESIPYLRLGGNSSSGKESRRTRRMLELRKRKGILCYMERKYKLQRKKSMKIDFC